MLYLPFLCFNSVIAIVGLTNNSVGRKCNQHSTCGECVTIGSILHLHCVPDWRRGRLVNDIEVYLVVGGEDTCKVGFVAKEHSNEAEVLDNKFVKVTDIYSKYDEDISRRTLYHQKYGYAEATIISNALD